MFGKKKKEKKESSIWLSGYGPESRGPSDPQDGPCCVDPTPAQKAIQRARADTHIREHEEQFNRALRLPAPLYFQVDEIRYLAQQQVANEAKHSKYEVPFDRTRFASAEEEAKYRIWLNNA